MVASCDTVRVVPIAVSAVASVVASVVASAVASIVELAVSRTAPQSPHG